MAIKQWNPHTQTEDYIDGVTTRQDGTVIVPALKAGDEAGSYLHIDSTGHLRQMGGSRLWDDSQVPAGSFRTGGQALTFAALTTNIYAYRFDVGDVIHMAVQMPHGMKAGTAIAPHIHLVNKNAIGAAAYNVGMRFYYIWSKIGSVFAGEQTEAEVLCSFQNATALTHKVKAFTEISPSSDQDGISSIFCCSVERIAASVESYGTADIYILGFDIHYEKDTLGSRTQFAK